MKKIQSCFGFKAFLIFLMIVLIDSVTMAQDNPKVEVNGHDVGAWFGENWLWVAGVIVLLLIIILVSSRSRSRTITTVRKNNGHITKTTTTDTE